MGSTRPSDATSDRREMVRLTVEGLRPDRGLLILANHSHGTDVVSDGTPQHFRINQPSEILGTSAWGLLDERYRTFLAAGDAKGVTEIFPEAT